MHTPYLDLVVAVVGSVGAERASPRLTAVRRRYQDL